MPPLLIFTNHDIPPIYVPSPLNWRSQNNHRRRATCRHGFTCTCRTSLSHLFTFPIFLHNLFSTAVHQTSNAISFSICLRTIPFHPHLLLPLRYHHVYISISNLPSFIPHHQSPYSPQYPSPHRTKSQASSFLRSHPHLQALPHPSYISLSPFVVLNLHLIFIKIVINISFKTICERYLIAIFGNVQHLVSFQLESGGLLPSSYKTEASKPAVMFKASANTPLLQPHLLWSNTQWRRHSSLPFRCFQEPLFHFCMQLYWQLSSRCAGFCYFPAFHTIVARRQRIKKKGRVIQIAWFQH